MLYLNDYLELKLATADDAEQILKVYEYEEFEGSISVIYTRRPNPYLSLLEEGEKVLLYVLWDHKEEIICGAGGCVIRKAYINGAVKNTAYLHGLKLLPEYRRKVPYIAKAYQFFYEQTKDIVDCYYTTILKENKLAQKMLEKKRHNMPEYEFKGIYNVYCFAAGRRIGESGYDLECGSKEGLEEFYKENAPKWSLFPSDFNLKRYPEDSIYTLRDASGGIVAAGVLWDQQAHKQYIVVDYKGVYKYLQWLPIRWFGYPNMPKKGEVANYANFHMLCVKDDDPNLGAYFIKKVAERAKGYDFLMIGLLGDHYLDGHMDRMKHIKYQSKFYEVNWEDSKGVLGDQKLHVDVGLL